MGLVPSWIDFEALYDRVTFAVEGKKDSPWVFEETNVDVDGTLKWEWDVKKAVGKSGGSRTNKGYVPSEIDVKILLWKAEHQERYESLLNEIRPSAGGKAPPVVYIVYPTLGFVQLFKFVVHDVMIPKFVRTGAYAAQFKFGEWMPEPKPAPAVKPAGNQTADQPQVRKAQVVVVENPNFKGNTAEIDINPNVSQVRGKA